MDITNYEISQKKMYGLTYNFLQTQTKTFHYKSDIERLLNSTRITYCSSGNMKHLCFVFSTTPECVQNVFSGWRNENGNSTEKRNVKSWIFLNSYILGHIRNSLTNFPTLKCTHAQRIWVQVSNWIRWVWWDAGKVFYSIFAIRAHFPYTNYLKYLPSLYNEKLYEKLIQEFQEGKLFNKNRFSSFIVHYQEKIRDENLSRQFPLLFKLQKSSNSHEIFIENFL